MIAKDRQPGVPRLFKALSGISTELWWQIDQNATRKRWRKGKEIQILGEAKTGAIMLLSGIIAVDDWTGALSSDFLLPLFRGTCIGFDASLNPTAEVTITAATDVEVLLLPTSALRRLIKNDHAMAMACWAVTQANLVEMTKYAYSMGTTSTEQRLISFLTRYLDHNNGHDRDQTSFPWAITQSKLAAFLGASRPHLNILLKRMQNKRFFVIKDGKIHIPRQSRLRQNLPQGQ